MSKIESFNKMILEGVDLHINMYKEQNLYYAKDDFILHVNNLMHLMKVRGMDPVVINATRKRIAEETGVNLIPPTPNARPSYSLR